MKPSARQRQQRAATKSDRRRRRKAKAPAPSKSWCPKCRRKTPEMTGGPLVRCTLCGGVKA